MERLSGWFRLWVFATVLLWGAGVVHFAILAHQRGPWTLPFTTSREELCANYLHQRAYITHHVCMQGSRVAVASLPAQETYVAWGTGSARTPPGNETAANVVADLFVLFQGRPLPELARVPDTPVRRRDFRPLQEIQGNIWRPWTKLWSQLWLYWLAPFPIGIVTIANRRRLLATAVGISVVVAIALAVARSRLPLTAVALSKMFAHLLRGPT